MEPRLSLPPDQLQQKFFALEKPENIAELLEVTYPLLEYWLFIAPPQNKYLTFTLRKTSGGFRKISAPNNVLKIIQQKLNQVLQAVYEVKKPVHGFVLGRSVVTNAHVHKRQHYVFNIDLQDFFPSINFGRVRGLFMGKPYSLPDNVATVLAQICCHENALPQGAPTSPVVANMICGQLDDQLLSLAKRHGCRYTRYADDITFSSSRLLFPPPIARSEIKSQSSEILWQVGSELEKQVLKNGFKINSEKVRMQTINQHQEVTGLTTNEFPNVKRQYVRQIRAMLHAWKKYGLAAAHREYYDQYNPKERGPYNSQPSFKKIVKGKIEFLGMVRGHNDPIYQNFREQYKMLATSYSQPAPIIPVTSPVIIEASKQFDRLGWIETLPFPLASILWTYEASDHNKEKCDHLLHFFEAFATFWATILLSGFDQDKSIFDPQFQRLSGFLAKQKHSFQRPTFGTWVMTAQNLANHLAKIKKQQNGLELCSRLFKTNDGQVLDLLSSPQLLEIFKETNQLRNSWKGHGGITSAKEASYRHEELQKHLDNIFLEIFHKGWPNYNLISPINSVQRESGLNEYRLQYLMGSRTPFQRRSQQFEHLLKERTLFLASSDSRQALQLLPFIHIESSPETAQNACYFYNRQDSNGVRLVSYHFEDASEITKDFPEITNTLNRFDSLNL